MTMSYAAAVAKLDEDLANGTPYLMLHIGSPGADGTANEAQKPSAAGDIVRKALSMAAAGAHATNDEASSVSDAAVSWAGADIATGQEISYATIWDAESAGNLLHIFAITTPKTTGSDGVTVPAGDLEVAISVFAKPA
jgi:hypothetical protein